MAIRPSYSRDTTIRRSGEASLKFVNSDPEKYRLCAQSIPVETGAKYEFSVWVKTEGVEGSETGATVCLEFTDADGKYVTGSYPTGITGTSDWTRITHVSQRIPENAAHGVIMCYLRKGMTGTAWWDGVELRRYRGAPFSMRLLSPNYRNELTNASASKLRMLLEANLRDYPQSNEDIVFVWARDRRRHGQGNSFWKR